MLNSDDYRRIFNYNFKVLHAFFDTLNKLPWETASRNMEASHHSLRNIFLHVLNMMDGWINHNAMGRQGEVMQHFRDYDDFRSMAEVKEQMEQVEAGVSDFLNRLEDRMLTKTITAPWLLGDHKLGDVLMQVTLEEADHVGEIIALLWQLDIEPPEMTWIMNTK